MNEYIVNWFDDNNNKSDKIKADTPGEALSKSFSSYNGNPPGRLYTITLNGSVVLNGKV